MACNCGKRRAQAQARRYTPNSSTTVRSGKSDGLVFSLILRDGTEQRFGSRLEADAANARAGYTGIVKQRPQS